MAAYMLTVLEAEEAHASQSPAAMAELIAGRTRFLDGLRRAGKLLDAGRLRPSGEGRRVRREGARLQVDGVPLDEGRRAVGAYYVVEAPDLEQAAGLGAGCPALPSDLLEVRPLAGASHVEPDKEGRPGKIFAFLVLGRAQTEAAWVEVMDRIDAETSGRFPAASFLGGARLRPPSTGRRLEPRGERRAVLDGPFLEAKEVVGGLFFLRLASLDEAVRWAGDSAFLRHGALEIRELWRS